MVNEREKKFNAENIITQMHQEWNGFKKEKNYSLFSRLYTPIIEPIETRAFKGNYISLDLFEDFLSIFPMLIQYLKKNKLNEYFTGFVYLVHTIKCKKINSNLGELMMLMKG